MRKLRQLIVGVGGAARADDPSCITRVGPPKRQLIDPIGLRHHPLAQAKGLKHLDRSARDAVSLPELERPRSALHYARGDPLKLRELRGEDEPCRPAGDDEHIDLAVILQRAHHRRDLERRHRRVPGKKPFR
jgi:hypothetical protein